ncbi:hypothetical protein H7347_00235 [Corynebacterium sp. zg-331]|uniref:hypothetical protein n=1 Tax=unclassified Corynebacterium TaxID=2624378 RepID=UPI00128AE43E|nr:MULTISPECIES: hypothetical protein [unclassified Corynebacterium]MBC3185025.1 hypothetical protein [Corynebacterium sp. zg-331]MPV51525.1 hypothetical protein [Corynebacterium sp. zg331]
MPSIAASARKLAQGQASPRNSTPITLRPGLLTPAEVVAVARYAAPVEIASETREAVGELS